MESIEKKKRQRFELLKRLYDITDGDTFQIVDMRTIGKELGLDDDATGSLVQYLIDEGLVKWAASGGLIEITHDGVLEIEEALDNPEKATEHFPAINLIQADTIIDSSIQLGGIRNVQITDYSREDLQALSGIIDSILKDIGSFNLRPDDEQQVRADLQTALAQAKSPKPRRDFVRASLKTVFDILIGVGTALATQHADKLLSFLK